MKNLNRVIAWVNAHRDYGIEFLRIYLGIGLFVRGVIQFSPSGKTTTSDLILSMDNSWGVPALILHYVMIAHLCGGAFLAIGLLTRLSALLQIPVLAGAVFLIHWHEGLFSLGQSLEFSSLVLFLLILLFIVGPGRLSMDYYIFGSRKKDNEH